jgi:hypothetical protein
MASVSRPLWASSGPRRGTPASGPPAAADRALDQHAARWAVGIGDGPAVLDHEAALGDMDQKGGVVRDERAPVLLPGVDGPPEAPVQADEPAAGAQGEPVQLDTGRRRIRHASLRWPATGLTR